MSGRLFDSLDALTIAMWKQIKERFHRFEKKLAARFGEKGFGLALACALFALVTPTYALTLALLGRPVQHLGWIILTPIFALLAKVFATIDWVSVRHFGRVSLIGLFILGSTLEVTYLGHLLHVHFAL